jgi:hypothetical protein
MLAELPEQADLVFAGNLKASFDKRGGQPGTVELGNVHPLDDIGRIDLDAFLLQHVSLSPRVSGH